MGYLARFTFLIGTAALFAGCAGSQPPVGVPGDANAIGLSLTHHRTFRYTGYRQSFSVPAGVTRLRVVALGGSGAASAGAPIGHGGRVYALIPVTPNERLSVYVGGNADGPNGGYNGGGQGGAVRQGSGAGYGGGGATDIREGGDALRDRILVAGGGGGQGNFDCNSYGGGGKGGGSTAGAGAAGCDRYSSGPGGAGGGGGRQHSGGRGGDGGYGTYGDGKTGGNGSLGVGGVGGDGGGCCNYSGGGGGGGGGGYHGGGGGGGGADEYYSFVGGGGGGGGGSSYIEPSAFKFQSWRGWKSPAFGLVVFSW